VCICKKKTSKLKNKHQRISIAFVKNCQVYFFLEIVVNLFAVLFPAAKLQVMGCWEWGEKWRKVAINYSQLLTAIHNQPFVIANSLQLALLSK